MTYAEKLQDPRWQQKRLRILERDNFCCKLCGDKETTLHIHHIKYDGDPWESSDDTLISYCKHCHYIVEFLKSEKESFTLKKSIKLRHSSGKNVVIFIIAQKGDLGAILSFNYFEEINHLEFCFSVPPPVIRTLNNELDILKHQING